MHDNKQQLNTLEKLLAEQLETYRMVARKLYEKKDVLVEGRYTDLSHLDQELIVLGQKTAHLEQARMELMMQMGHADKTLTQLIKDFHGSDDARRLLPLRDDLRHVLGEIDSANHQTKSLLDLSIQWVAQTVEVIARAITPEGAAYNRQGGSSRIRQDSTNPISTHSTVIHDA